MTSEGLLDEARDTGAFEPDVIQSLIQRALNPADPGLGVVGWPGRRLTADLAAGDLVLRHGAGGRSAMAVVTDPRMLNRRQLAPRPDQPWSPGGHVRVMGASGPLDGRPFTRRIATPEGFVLPETYVLRVAENAEAPPLPPPGRPMLRKGSTGPSVAEAQSRLNTVHARQLASAGRGLDRCPLDVDGKFGPATDAAVRSFQRLAFPGLPNEWDGIIGPKTWTALEAWSREQPGPPDPPGPNPPYPPDPDPPGPPILPVIDRPLDPDRWAAILSAAASSNAVLRTGNAVRTLIDGRETFEEMVSDIRLAKTEQDYIYLLGWDITDDFALIPGDKASTVRQLLSAASGRGVQIRVMLWAKPPLVNTLPVRFVNGLANGAAIRDDETPNKTPMSTARLQTALATAGVAPVLIPLIIALIKPDLARLTGSHHQKVLVVKRGDVLVGYCGGLDINANRLNIVDPKAGHPHHDDHCRIVGPSAWDLLQTFIKRWRHHPDSAGIDTKKGALRGASEPIPSPIRTPTAIDSPFGMTCSVIVGRTFTPTHKAPGVGRERDIRDLLMAAIPRANRFIYLEDQYLIDMDTAAALNRAVPKLAHVTILILGTPINDMPFGAEYRRDFIERMLKGLSSTDRAKVGVFQLSSSQVAPSFGFHTYVHAKSWVIDDELAVIGTANCNRRGYQHDSEVDAFIFDDPPPPLVALAGGELPRVALREADAGEQARLGLTFAQHYRMRLWREHLGAPISSVLDGVTSAALWRTRLKTARVMPFDHRLPPSKTQTLRDQAAEALRFLVDPVP